ncbi:MAG: chromosome segregation protein SMC, partial [Clostridia bacterium]|nr:chromosome segregation protein SMC [Clostridia bacterium]
QDIAADSEQTREEARSLDGQAASVDGQAAVLESSIGHNNETIGRIENDRLDAGRDSEELQKEIETNLKLINQLERLIIDKKRRQQEITVELEATSGQSGSLADEAAEAAATVASLTKQLADARVDASTASSSIEEINTRISTVDELITARQVNCEKAEKVLADAKKSVKSCEEKIKEISNSLSGYKLKYDKKDKKADGLKRELDDISFERQKTDSRIKLLEDLEKNMEGYTGSVKAVIRQASSGRLKGIRGALSQLIDVKDEYATAVETALGNAVQNIVTENENNAKQAIFYLQKNNLGRATFLPLTSVKGRELEEDGLEEEDGYIDIAASLVSCNAEYDEIVWSLLGKTAVAEDIDCAIAIAKKYEYRFKIVTLDGQVVNAGGSITGGSRTQNAGILTRASEIESLKKKVAEIDSEIKAKKQEYDGCLKELAKCKADVDGLSADLMNAQEEKIRREGKVSLCAEQLAAARESLDELTTERSTADGRIAMLKIALDNALAAVESISAEIEKQEDLLPGLGEKREAFERTREEIAETVTTLNLEIHDAQKDSASRRETVNQLRFRLLNQDDRANQLEREIKELKEKNREIAETVGQLRRQAQQFRALAQQKRGGIEQLLQVRDESQALSSSLRVQERTETADREKLSGELARLEERKTAKQKEYEDTVSKLYDEYQLTRREAQSLGIEIEDVKQAGRRLGEIKNSIRALGSVNVGAIEEYEQVSERYRFMGAQIKDIEISKEQLLKLIDDLTGKMSEQFREEFAKINTSFGETFAELFGGGKAELILEDPHDVLECNIEIKVQPPGKNVKNIDLLSGGEKGLSAIALLFAILKVNPAPFCIFDEVEAALDEVNVTRYAQYVRRMTQNTQFIVITHRRGTMEEADVLYGITMQEEGVSKLLELKTAEMAKRLGIS